MASSGAHAVRSTGRGGDHAAALHMHTFLESVLPAFRWLTVGGFFLGLLESFLWGVNVGLVFGWIHNALAHRWSAA